MRKWIFAFITALLCFMQSEQAFSQTPLPWQGGGQQQQQSSQSQDSSLHSVNGVPLFIDGTQTKTKPKSLSPELLDQVRNVTTLGDALKILGPAYAAPDDNLHIAHWHFQNGTMLTLWPQGGETLNDTVSVYPRPDCGVPASQCNDLVLGRKPGAAQQHKRGGGGNTGSGNSGGSNSNSGSPMSFVSPLMKMIPGR